MHTKTIVCSIIFLSTCLLHAMNEDPVAANGGFGFHINPDDFRIDKLVPQAYIDINIIKCACGIGACCCLAGAAYVLAKWETTANDNSNKNKDTQPQKSTTLQLPPQKFFWCVGMATILLFVVGFMPASGQPAR